MDFTKVAVRQNGGTIKGKTVERNLDMRQDMYTTKTQTALTSSANQE